MSDLHGEYGKFMQMLKVIDFKPEDTLYILGDVIDRGSKSILLLRYIMNQPNIKLILGNHEEMMIQSLVNDDRGHYFCWMSSGGISTLNQFDNLNINDQHEILDYLQQLPLTVSIELNNVEYLLVHAGVDFDAGNEQKRDTLLWTKDEFINSVERFEDVVIVFGHTPTCFMQPNVQPLEIWKAHSGKIGVDCGACFADGRLGCLRLDDMAEFYV
jgi:serine/threonine protein phosphatase 1